MSLVRLAECHTYDLDAVRRAVRDCLSAISVIQQGLRPGVRVLLKPNIINPMPPETATCTHPALIRAVAELACEARCEVLVADEPGYALTGIPSEVFEMPGIAQACQGLPVQLDLLKHGGYQKVAVPNPLQIREVSIARRVLECDLLINLPKCKTHQQTLLTGAIKNMFGAAAPRERIRIHALGTVGALSEALADVFSTCVPHVNVMDAVVGMEGKGPSRGTPRPIGLIAASEDAVALDAVIESITGFAPGEVRVTTAAAQKGLGECDLSRIATEGADPCSFQVRLRRPPGVVRRGFPRALGMLLSRHVWVRPVVVPKLCVACGACAAVCPAEAIQIRDRAIIDRQRCIECFCCQEVCPQRAIDTQRSWLARKIIGR